MIEPIGVASYARFGNDLEDAFGSMESLCICVTDVPNRLEFGQHEGVEMSNGPTDFHHETLKLGFEEWTLHFEIDMGRKSAVVFCPIKIGG